MRMEGWFYVVVIVQNFGEEDLDFDTKNLMEEGQGEGRAAAHRK